MMIGYNYSLLFDIIGHRKDDTAITKENGYYQIRSGIKRKVNTTKLWDLCVRWETGETSYISLKDIKDSYSIEVAEYVFSKHIEDEPAFVWWARTTLK